MIPDVVLMLLLLPNIVANSVSISDVVRTDTNFYYRTFLAYPSKLATLEYSLMFNITKINHYCRKDGCRIVLAMYTTEDDKNLKTNCSNDAFGQLQNRNLYTKLSINYKPYRFTTCRLDELDSDILHCEGKTTIQDYKPRRYGFSFGYDCDISAKPSLKGLLYNFTISRQSNQTHCLPIPHYRTKTIEECMGFYNHIAIPNLIGIHDINSLHRSVSISTEYESVISYLTSQLPTGGCYKHFKEIFCRIFIPECDPDENQMMHICKETCSEFLHSCLKLWSLTLDSVKWKWKKKSHPNISDVMDCNYLPSVNGPIPCYYKPVMCDPPPNVTNARITNGIVLNGTYLAMSQVEYECSNETYQMEGNSTVTCLYSGKWYKMPKCEIKNESNVNPLSIVIPLLIVPFCILIITRIAKRCACMRKKLRLLERNREYDAFVCYNFDEDNDFVFNSILPQLEENYDPPLQMFIHDRDFIPGRNISINIHNAINSCNSAIIVMSQGFIDSPRCREEFTKCLAESEKIPAFKLFVIVMEKVDTLANVPENMKMFFREKTYLKRDDPDLFEKIGKHLKLMRQYDVKDDNIELEHLFQNQDET